MTSVNEGAPQQTVKGDHQSFVGSHYLKHPKAREIFLQLCTKTDIVVENFKPGTLSKWGIGYQEVSNVKPDIIYISISMFGQFGPLSKRPGYDPLAQNFTGWSSLNGPPSIGATKAPTWLADDLSGLHGVIGALAALTHRNKTGEGQHVDVSLVDSLLFQSNGFLTSGSLDIPLQKLGNRSAITDPVNVYKCMDGEVFVAALLQNHWKALSVLIDKKELSEHLMLLDLGRNDAGKVSKINSVKVTESFIIERYSHVMHIVSNVVGKYNKKFSKFKSLLAGFPAGTVSGAPKIRAMEIIDDLETSKRKVYAGGIGYFSANGEFDTCIALRTAVAKNKKFYVQAGAGIVADSKPKNEYEETVNKAKALINALR